VSRVRVVAAVIVRGGEVLAARRGPQQRQPLLWEFPGGKVEPGETDAEALQRELGEELAVEVSVGSRVGEVIHRYSWGTICLVAYRCALVRGTPMALEHAEVRWVDSAGLASLEWAPADRPLLGSVVASLPGATGGSR